MGNYDTKREDDEYGILHVKYETGSMFYYVYDSQVLLDWVVEPIDETNRSGAIRVDLPEGYFAYKNHLYSIEDAKNTEWYIKPEERQFAVVLTEKNVLMGKAKYMLHVARRVDQHVWHGKNFPRHRMLSITTGRKEDR